jgi:anti-sigma B factor antagonist
MDVAPVDVGDSRRSVLLPAEVDIANGEAVGAALRESISAAGGGEVVADCSGLKFIDSSGAAALLAAYRVANANGVVLKLAHLHGGPLTVLRILGVADLFGLD